MDSITETSETRITEKQRKRKLSTEVPADARKSLKLSLSTRPISAFDENFPHFAKPERIGEFSLDSNGAFSNDRDSLRYYVRPSGIGELNFSLSDGFTSFKKRTEANPGNIENLLKWVLFFTKSRGIEFFQDSTISWRGLLTTLAASVYESQQGWSFAACRLKGVTFLREVETENQRKRNESLTDRDRLMMYWGFKFEQFMCSDKREGKPNTTLPVNNNTAYCQVVKTRLGTNHLIFGGETDCVSPDTGGEEQFIELKTNRVLQTDRQNRSFRRFKALKTWLQSFLIGVNRVVFGFRDDDGVLKSIQEFSISELHSLSKGQYGELWKGAVCFNFLKALISFVKTTLDQNNSGDTLLFSWDPSDDYVKVTNATDMTVLPEWQKEQQQEGSWKLRLIGMYNMSSDSLVLTQLKKDDFLRRFVEDDTTISDTGSSIAEQLQKLAEGIQALDEELHLQVTTHHDSLLSQAVGVEKLEDVLQMMKGRIVSLKTAVARIKLRVDDLAEKIVVRTSQLRALQDACDLLRRLLRYLQLSGRLRQQLEGGPRELGKAAVTVGELDFLSERVDMSGIDMVEADRRFVRQARIQVETNAHKLLEQGFESQAVRLGFFQNQSQIGTALQVFQNLSSLEPTVRQVLAHLHQRLVDQIGRSLEPHRLSAINTRSGQHHLSAPGGAAMPSPGAGNAAFRAQLWSGVEHVMDTLFSIFSQVDQLQKVLSKKRDPVTHVLFIEQLVPTGHDRGDRIADGSAHYNMMDDFWDQLTASLKEKLEFVAGESTYVKQTLEAEFPKLLRLCNELWKRLAGSNSSYFSTTPQTDSRSYKRLRGALLTFEKAYVARSLSRLFDPINLVFASTGDPCPSNDEIGNILKIISSELHFASIDSVLHLAVARNVTKTVSLLLAKTEQSLYSDDDAYQVIGPPNASQTQNFRLINSLSLFHEGLGRIEADANLPADVVSVIADARKQVEVMMTGSLAPLLAVVRSSIEAIILTMHEEDFSGSDEGSISATATERTGEPCSLYMKELERFVSHINDDFLSVLHSRAFVYRTMLPVASRTVRFFVRHACLVRPLGRRGAMRLAADCAQLESALSPFWERIGDLGSVYKLLRALKPLLFQSLEQIEANPSVGESVPHATVLHLMFGRCPAVLNSPHQSLGWSLADYSQWLDQHDEADQLSVIRGALDAYANSVNQRHDTSYIKEFPIMMELLRRSHSVR